MAEHLKIGLDNNAFQGRLRKESSLYVESPSPEPKPIQNTPLEGVFDGLLENINDRTLPATQYMVSGTDEYDDLDLANVSDMANMSANTAALPSPTPSNSTVELEPIVQPGQRHGFIQEQAERLLAAKDTMLRMARRLSAWQLTMLGMAATVFVVGALLSLQTLRANNAAAAQIQSLTKQIDQQPDVKN